MAGPEARITIKRYGDRRLYDPSVAAYVTLGDLAAMVDDDEEFLVVDAKSGADITPSILRQIIHERGSHG